MTPQEQALNLLGIARRAKALVTGESFVIEAIRSQDAKFVVLAADAGPSTAKKITDKSSFYQVPIYRGWQRDELSHAIGMDRTAIAVTDQGFAKKLIKLLT